MAVLLSPRWELTTDHAASSYGQPVLVDRTSGDAYGPADVLAAYPSWGLLPAPAVVRRLVALTPVAGIGAAAVAAFCGDAR